MWFHTRMLLNDFASRGVEERSRGEESRMPKQRIEPRLSSAPQKNSCFIMWNPACSQSLGGTSSHRAGQSKRSSLHILPCTVSQLLAADHVSSGDSFIICDCELNQVSVVGIVRAVAPFVTHIQFSVDDMTGPPLTVKQWVNTEDGGPMTHVSPGSYVKVTGSLRSFSGQRSVLAMNVRCVTDLNEITSHMLEVVRAHMQLVRKTYDVNMNTTAVLGLSAAGLPKGIVSKGLSTIQGEVLHVITKFSVRAVGISLYELQTELDYLTMRDLRTALTFLLNEGHVFSTMDENHFKAADC